MAYIAVRVRRDSRIIDSMRQKAGEMKFIRLYKKERWYDERVNQ